MYPGGAFGVGRPNVKPNVVMMNGSETADVRQIETRQQITATDGEKQQDEGE